MSLDELEKDLLRAARRELAPAPADRERHEALLLARAPWTGTQAPSTPRRSGRSSLSSARASLTAGHFGMLGLGLVVGALAGGWLGLNAARSGWGALPEPEQRLDGAGEQAERQWSEPGRGVLPPPVPSRVLAVPERSEPSSMAPSGPVSAPVVPREADSPAAPREVVPRARPGAASSHGGAAASSESSESSLAAEVAMLQRARRALAAHNGRLSLGIVEELDQRFPHGVLQEERSATRVLSLCELARVEEARSAGRAFLERYPASVYAERVRESCAGAAGE